MILAAVGVPFTAGCSEPGAISSELSLSRAGGSEETQSLTPVRSPSAKGTADDVMTDDEAEHGKRFHLPRPSEMSVIEFEKLLFPFLREHKYAELGWVKDKSVRDTGPYIDGKYYGTHPAVRVYYSPGVMRWLTGGRKGPIPDGEMIIKEQYAPPALQHHGKSESELRESLESWTVMIKDSRGSHDGWFWSNPGADGSLVNYHQENTQAYSGFGLYCIRCHASTKSPGIQEPHAPDNEFTFIDLRNIEGFPGEPILFRVDDSWQRAKPEPAAMSGNESETQNVSGDVAGDTLQAMVTRNAVAEFLGWDLERLAPQPLPPSSYDSVVASRDESQQFVTSDQCMSCHAGLTGPFGPVGFVHSSDAAGYGEAGVNVSPYGEWRWTPMGLAGRDPVFYAQLASEVAMNEEQFGNNSETRELSAALVDTCFKCHGPMGHRQFHAESNADAGFEPGIALAHPAPRDNSVPSPDLSSPETDSTSDSPVGVQPEHASYGALARDGVSCMVCHRMQPRPQAPDDDRPYLEFFLESSITGNIHLGPDDTIFGPYKDKEIAPYAMQHGTGLKPAHSDYIQQSQLCGSCHTVSLPTVDWPLDLASDISPNEQQLVASESVEEFRKYHHHVEQATYLEWLNSEFNNEFDPTNSTGQSCQDCHMDKQTFADEAGELAGDIKTRIAAIQDITYPDAENLASHEDLNVRQRTSYSRHNFSGLNVWLLEMFRQFNGELGIKMTDYMTGSDNGADQAIAHMQRRVQRTAKLELESRLIDSDQQRILEADLKVANLSGHRFPTGVGFRRAFIEFLVVEKTGTEPQSERLVWASGRTNAAGVLIDMHDRPLDTEFFARSADVAYSPDSDLRMDADESQPARIDNATIDGAPDIDASVAAQSYQRHHEIIEDPRQVQVYETLLKNHAGDFTTSFVRGCEAVKDNRLLPRGWTPQGPGRGLRGAFLNATLPGPGAMQDADFTDGSGSDKVTYRVALPDDVVLNRLEIRATLYYQALPPYYLKNLSEAAPHSPATQRLMSLVGRLELTGTAIEDWKLRIGSVSSPIGGNPSIASRLVHAAE